MPCLRGVQCERAEQRQRRPRETEPQTQTHRRLISRFDARPVRGSIVDEQAAAVNHEQPYRRPGTYRAMR